MRTGHRTFARAVLAFCVMLSMVLSSLPDTAEAAGRVFEQAQPHHHAGAQSGHATDEDAAADRHCHPGFDCQTASMFVNDPRFEIQIAERVQRFVLARSDGQSLTIPFDLPPPRNGS